LVFLSSRRHYAAYSGNIGDRRLGWSGRISLPPVQRRWTSSASLFGWLWPCS